MTTTTQITTLVLGLSAPLNLVIIGSVWNMENTAFESARTALKYAANSVAAGVDAHLSRFADTALTLSRSPNVRGDNIAELGVEASRDLADQSMAWVVVTDANGREELDNRKGPGGPPLPMRSAVGMANQRTAFARRAYSVSGVSIDRVWGTRTVFVDAPVFKDNLPFRDVAVAVKAWSFLRMLASQEMPRNWVVTLTDGRGTVIARLPSLNMFDDKGEEAGTAPGGNGGGYLGDTVQSADVIEVATARVASADWTVSVGVRKQEIHAAAWAAASWAATFGCLLSVATLAIALLVARRMARQIANLRDSTAAILSGEDVIFNPESPEIADVWEAVTRAASDRGRTMSALAAAKAEKDDILTSIDDGVGAIDATMRFIYLNDHAKRILHLEAGRDFTGQHYREVAPQFAGNELEQRIHEVLDTRVSCSFEAVGRTTGRWYSISVFHRQNDGIAIYFRDIESQKNAEIALRESEQHYRLLFENALIGAAEMDVHGHITRANDRYCKLTGYTEQELVGKTPVDLAPSGDREDVERLLESYLKGDVDSYETEKRYLKKDGSLVWVQVAVAPIRDESGEILHSVAIIEDVTERRRAEADLRLLNASLADRIRAATEERDETAARLAQSEKLAALGQLAGGVAHDFNNVIQAVSGAASQIAKHAENMEKVQRYAKMISDVSRRGASVTKRLLAIARKGELQPEKVDVLPLLGDMRELLTHTLGANIAVKVEGAQRMLPAYADRSQLETVLVNVAANARDAMPSGGAITFAATQQRIVAGDARHGLRPGDYVRIAVRDTGEGMSPETLLRAMEPFFTTKPKGEGTGLGLPMARGFSEQSGGGLEVESEPGVGTSVVLWLPTAGEEIDAPAERRNAQVDGAKRRVLLVDDEEVIRVVLGGEMKDNGFEVIRAENGEKAIQLLSSDERIDAIVSDLSMPGIDGITVIKEAQKLRPGMPTILLTGYAGDAATMTIGKSMNDRFCLLRKPVSGARLSDQVAAMLETDDA